MKPKHTILDLMAVSLACVAGLASADPIQPEPGATPAATRQAIQAAIDAAASTGGTVTLAAGTFEIDAQLMVTNGVTLEGQGWERTIIKQTANGTDKRCATVDGNASIQHVTLTGGCINGNNETGAGVKITDGTVSWCCITNNTAGVSSGSSVYGGGVGFYQGKGQVDHSIIADNLVNSTTPLGGGIGIYRPAGAIVIDTCLVVGNVANAAKTAANGKGGGIYLEYMFWYADVTIRNSTIAGNSASGTTLGGGLYVTGDSDAKGTHTILMNDIMAGNTSASVANDAVISKTDKTSYCLFGLQDEVVGTSCFSGNPAFIDAANGDYHLSASSPAIGAGTTTDIGHDLDNIAFADPPAMGCYEYADRAAEPAFDPASGILFYPSTNVTLSCETTGATIYYTTDGSSPTDSGTAYSGPIALSATTTIKARAYATGKGPSAIVSATYTHQRPTPPPTAFAKSVEITLSTALATTEITTGVPALVKLSASNISGFDYADFTIANGGDMMFVDANGNPLPHEVDTWNTSGESLVWVKLPSTAANTTITMYYGRGTTSTVAATGVWTDYVGVWHLGEEGGANTDVTVHDSTENGYSGTAKGIATSGSAAGKIGSGWRISDSSTSTDKVGGILMDSMTNVTLGDEFTVSAWMWHKNQAYYYDHVFYRRNASNDGTAGWWSEINGSTDNTINVNGGANGGKSFYITSSKNVWIHLSLVYSGSNGYSVVNGVQTATQTITAASDNQRPIAFGTDSDNNDVSWKGIFDELRIRKGPYDSNYLAAEYKAMNTAETDIFSYGPAQDTGPETTVRDPVFDPASGATFYPSTNVTLSCATDGATIHYTTDGTDPTDSSTEYTAPISVSATTTIKAVAYKQDLDPSAVVSATYTYVTPPVGIQPGESAAANTQTIQDAIDAAATLSPAGTVVLGAGIFEINAQLMVTGGVTLVGQGWTNTVVKQTANGQRVATLRDGSTLAGVTVTGGKLTANWTHGAGVMVEDGTVSWCCISNNTSTARNVHGAGVSFWKGTIDHSIVAFNQLGAGTFTSSGGGIGGYYDTQATAVSRYGSVMIDTCLVYGNAVYAKNVAGTEPEGQGGGVAFVHGFPNVTIRNTTISGNFSNHQGGGLYAYDNNSGNRVTLMNSIVSGNILVSGESSVEDNVFGSLASASTNNLIGSDPAFVDAANGDYRLLLSSPALGTGATIGDDRVDLDRTAFSDPPSIGCYEYDPLADKPAFGVSSDETFYPTVSVTISCATAGAKIYYTTDGSLPTDSSDEYTGAITLSATTTVKARAYADGMGPSAVATATYTYKKRSGVVIFLQ